MSTYLMVEGTMGIEWMVMKQWKLLNEWKH
jgi:hypothetical protein